MFNADENRLFFITLIEKTLIFKNKNAMAIKRVKQKITASSSKYGGYRKVTNFDYWQFCKTPLSKGWSHYPQNIN